MRKLKKRILNKKIVSKQLIFKMNRNKKLNLLKIILKKKFQNIIWNAKIMIYYIKKTLKNKFSFLNKNAKMKFKI